MLFNYYRFFSNPVKRIQTFPCFRCLNLISLQDGGSLGNVAVYFQCDHPSFSLFYPSKNIPRAADVGRRGWCAQKHSADVRKITKQQDSGQSLDAIAFNARLFFSFHPIFADAEVEEFSKWLSVLLWSTHVSVEDPHRRTISILISLLVYKRDGTPSQPCVQQSNYNLLSVS